MTSAVELAKKQLLFGVQELDLGLDEKQINLLMQYAVLLLKWNKVYSLTAITELTQVVTLHLLDGLTIIPYMGLYKSVIDVGSGMGVPSVIIAICCPDIHVMALDCNHKKVAFLQQVAIELHLNNFSVLCSRVEKYIPKLAYDLAISRAFSSSKMFIELTKHLIAKDGQWMLMKSHKVQTELENIQGHQYTLDKLYLPNSLDTRYLLRIIT